MRRCSRQGRPEQETGVEVGIGLVEALEKQRGLWVIAGQEEPKGPLKDLPGFLENPQEAGTTSPKRGLVIRQD